MYSEYPICGDKGAQLQVTGARIQGAGARIQGAGARQTGRRCQADRSQVPGRQVAGLAHRPRGPGY